jgi:hypothetical protein
MTTPATPTYDIMKHTFNCGHTGKGKYCHACAAVEKEKQAERAARAAKRAASHPFALDGKPLKSSAGRLLSVPVGRSYRLLFDAPTLKPLRIVSHEHYNAIASSRVMA